MRTNNVVVLPYSQSWKVEFNKLNIYLSEILKESIISIEHVGSTSVEGLSAKPIIDIDVVIEGYEIFEEVKRRLEAVGYTHEGNLGIEAREAFKYTNKPEFMTHHLYVCPKDSEELKRHLAFRDYLRSHAEDTRIYSEVKLEAALKYPTDIDSYIAAKSPCIEELYRKIGL